MPVPRDERTHLTGLFPATDPWNARVDSAPLLPGGDAILKGAWPDAQLRQEFSAKPWNGTPTGLPYVVVGPSQRLVKVWVTQAEGWERANFDGLDPTGAFALAPIPADAPVEMAQWADSDRHVIVLQTDASGKPSKLFELWRASRRTDGTGDWSAQNLSIFDVTKPSLQRPMSKTSADAAGFPILPGLITYEGVQAALKLPNPEDRHLGHAIRFTVAGTSKRFVLPATHFAGSSAAYPPIGLRVRLKSSFDLTTAAPAWMREDWANGAYSKTECEVIVRTLKRYGGLLADNGGNWFFSGAPNERWNDTGMAACFETMHGRDFEVVVGSSGLPGIPADAIYEGYPGYKTAAARTGVGCIDCPN